MPTMSNHRRKKIQARQRKAENAKKREAKAKGVRLPIEEIKRFPTGPKAAYTVKAENVTTLQPLAFDDMM